uniref:Uncharacterized protein n=1 Tax=Oryza nivara TaxID=4536 RepID=A0A0E0GCJ2_ORYNI
MGSTGHDAEVTWADFDGSCTPMKSNMSGSKNGQVLKSAELYNSETGHWETLADMNLARRLSSSFFLDGFYRCKVAYDIALNRPVVCGEWPMYATEISFVWPCWLSQPFDMFGKEVTFVSVEF